MSDLIVSRCGNRTVRGQRGVCAEAHQAIREGILLADCQRGGWINIEIPLRHMSKSARWFGEENCKSGFKDHTGEFYLIEICPMCGGCLPDVVVQPVQQCDGYEQ